MVCFGKVDGEWYLCGNFLYLSVKVLLSGETILLPTWAKNGGVGARIGFVSSKEELFSKAKKFYRNHFYYI